MSFIDKILKTPPPEYTQEDRSDLDPMEKAKRTWDRRTGNLVIQNYNLRRITFLLCIIILVLTGGLVIQSLKSSVKPYVIEVDSTTGLVKNVGLVQEQAYSPSEAEIKYFLGQFIKNVREIPLDAVIYKQNINTAYAFMTRDAANKMNNLLSHDENLIQDIGKKTVITKINTVLPIAGSNNSWQVRWSEETYILGSEKKTVSDMSAVITIVMKAPTDQATLQVNPLGIYVQDFSWDKEAVKKSSANINKER